MEDFICNGIIKLYISTDSVIFSFNPTKASSNDLENFNGLDLSDLD